jgi:tRNA1Val (adenine37-N6)-methyltransferase
VSVEDPTSSNIFDWQGIRILQGETVHKIGTDAVLLGAWVATVVTHASTILDAGTGTGILALMMARHFPEAEIMGIDVDMQALQLASQNVRNTNSGEKIVIDFEDVLIPPKRMDQSYNLIVCNPPYYTAHTRPFDDFKAKAKHMDVPVQQWINGLLSRLAANGHLCIIVPGATAAAWICAANEQGYYNLHRVNILSYEDDPLPIRCLLHFSSGLEKPQIRQLSIYAKVNTYTDDYLALTGIRSGKETTGNKPE